MSRSLLFLVAVGLVQSAYSQVLGLGNGVGCNNLAANGIGLNGFIPNGLGPNLIGNGLGLPAAGVAPVGYGDVVVTGELPVGGTTTVGGQVPVIGYVTFEANIPAGGLVSVANNCGCNTGIY